MGIGVNSVSGDGVQQQITAKHWWMMLRRLGWRTRWARWAVANGMNDVRVIDHLEHLLLPEGDLN